MITLVDYGTGNLRSVTNALERLGAAYRLTADAAEIASAEKILLPGVGEAATAMHRLEERGLTDVLRHLKQPVLGICLGMQLLCSHSEERDTPCLGVFPNKVRLFSSEKVKVPQIGWNAIYNLRSPLYDGIQDGEYVYYVHSYFAEVNEFTAATTDYPEPFSGSLAKGNYYGCQFHPEKSGAVGERILANFLKL